MQGALSKFEHFAHTRYLTLLHVEGVTTRQNLRVEALLQGRLIGDVTTVSHDLPVIGADTYM